jgi:hypothetical protein
VNDDRIVKLLEEIRDLQRQHVENYKSALTNQQESIALQKRYSRRTIPVIIGVLLFLLLTVYGPWIWHWLFAR